MTRPYYNNFYVLLALVLFALTACSTPKKPAPTPPPTAKAPQTVRTPPSHIDPSRLRPAPELEADLERLWRDFPGTVGIAVTRIDGGWTRSFGNQYLPQQSVSKLWVAMTLLSQWDNGQLQLGEVMRITPQDLTLFHQPLAAKVRAQGHLDLSLDELIERALTRSDNSANDSLLRRVGGPDAVRLFLAQRALDGIRFGPGERLLQSQISGLTWQQSYSAKRAFQKARKQLPRAVREQALDAYLNDPVDGAQPEAIVRALKKLAQGQLLSPNATQRLLDTLSRTRSGPRRLKAGLPHGWRIAHKTGTGQDLSPVSTGYNNVGIITAPDGGQYAVAVMIGVTDTRVPTRMRLMQNVSASIARWHWQ